VVYRPTNVVEVRAWDTQVGAIALDPASGYYAFEYSPDWAQRGVEIAPLQMPLGANPSRRWVFPHLPELTFRRLPAVFADSLPDAFGNALVDAALAAEGVAPTAITSLDRLVYLGRRGTGALEYHPPRDRRGDKTTAIELSELVVAARAALSGDLRSQPEQAIADLIRVGTSAGGRDAKAVIAWNRRSGELRSGQVDAPEGFEQWLLKLDVGGPADGPGLGAHRGRVEFAFHRMALAAGITMSECHLLPDGDRAHFMTRRFDRDGNDRVHLQSLCAMAHLDYTMLRAHDYGQLFQTIDRLGLGADARAEAFRRMVFNVLAGNTDDHTKNHAFLMAADGTWSLGPAYDLTFTYNPRLAWASAHQMSVNGAHTAITAGDLHAVGDRFLVPGYKQIIKDVIDAVSAWASFADEAGLPGAPRDEITSAQGALLTMAR
jgi:serine/threonine-protein kinase HipA